MSEADRDAFSPSLPLEILWEIALKVNRSGRSGRATWQNIMCSCRELRARCSHLINAIDIDEGSYDRDEKECLKRFPHHATLTTLRFSLGYHDVISVLSHTGRTFPSRLSDVARIELEDTDDKLRGRLVKTIVDNCPSVSTLILRIASGYYHSLRTTPQFFEAFESAVGIKNLSFESPLSRPLKAKDVSHFINVESLELCHERIDHDVVQALAGLPILKELGCESLSVVSPIDGTKCAWRILRLQEDHATELRLLSLPSECQAVIRDDI